MTNATESDAALLLDRLELLRLRTLLVGSLGILGLVACLVALVGHVSNVVTLGGEALLGNAKGFHVPANLFQEATDGSWARTPFLLQLAFAAIGIGGIVQMTSKVLSKLQVRLWFAVLLCLATCIIYTTSDFGSVWHTSQRDLVNALRAKEWERAAQLSSTSKNAMSYAYVMAQIGLLKPDARLLELHGKTLVDQIDQVLMHSKQDFEPWQISVLHVTDNFKPKILRDIDVAVYGAPHTEIGLRLAQPAIAATPSTSRSGWGVAHNLLSLLVAAAGIGAAIALLRLWIRMAARLHWLRPKILAKQ